MSSAQKDSGAKKTAGAFDIRNIIGGLIGLYGVVLVVVGLVDNSKAALAKAGGVNADLWAGIAMIVVALVFVLWSRLRPIVVQPKADGTSD